MLNIPVQTMLRFSSSLPQEHHITASKSGCTQSVLPIADYIACSTSVVDRGLPLRIASAFVRGSGTVLRQKWESIATEAEANCMFVLL